MVLKLNVRLCRWMETKCHCFTKPLRMEPINSKLYLMSTSLFKSSLKCSSTVDCVVLSVSMRVHLSPFIPYTYSERFLKLTSVLITWYLRCSTGWGSTWKHKQEETRSIPATMRRNPPTQPQKRASPNSHLGTTSGTLSSKKCITAKWAM